MPIHPVMPAGVGRIAPQIAGAAGHGVPVTQPQDQVHLGPHPSGLQLRLSDGSLHDIPSEGQFIHLGRRPENEVTLGDNGVSGRHARMTMHQGRLWVQDLKSTNGTYVNGTRIPPEQWVPVGSGDQVRLGRSSAGLVTPQPVDTRHAEPVVTALPDGREALVQHLPSGNIRCSKVDFALPVGEYKPDKFFPHTNLRAGGTQLQDLRVGHKYMSTAQGGMQHVEFLGTDAQGRLRFGHTMDYTPADYTRYLKLNQEDVDRKREAGAARLAERRQGSDNLRRSEMSRLGLTPQHLLDVQGSAAWIYRNHGLHAHDGTDIWPAPIRDAIVQMKRADLARYPDLAKRGLSDLRLEQWQAGKRGELLLFRGVKGAYNPAEPSGFYTPDLGCALHYAHDKDGHRESSVSALRIPRTDVPRFYRDVGSVPGRNHYAEVYDVKIKDLDEPRSPSLLMSSTHTEQKWIMNRLEANMAIQDPTRGLDDYSVMMADLMGKQQ